MQPGRDLDSKLWELLTGHKTAMWTTCVCAEGIWDVFPESKPERWTIPAEHSPVYIKECVCEFFEDEPEEFKEPKHNGHVASCYAVVPHLSTTHEGTGTVMEAMFDHGWMGSLTVCKFVVDGKLVPRYLADFEAIYCNTKYKADHETGPGAVAMAAYNALSAKREKEL